MKLDDLVSFSAYAEKKWLEQAHALLNQHGTLPVTSLIAELALRLDISVLTSRRYLMKHSAMSGSLFVHGGEVSLKDF